MRAPLRLLSGRPPFMTGLALAVAVVLVLLLSGCGEAAAGPRSLPARGAVAGGLLPAPGTAAMEPPRYGGDLNVGTVYVTLSALSWDTADWNWKQNHDTGMFYEQLFAADLEQAAVRGGRQRFVSEAYLPPETIRGELAQSWEWEDPLTLVVGLRRGVVFPDKPGVMESRELDAHDVIFSFERLRDSAKAIPTYFDHIDRVAARDDHTVVFEFGEFNAEWDYRFGYGYFSGIVPRELAHVDAGDWRNVTGSGPFSLARFIPGNSQTYVRNPHYWDRTTIGGGSYGIPFVDRLIYRTIKDEATYLTALRTGKLDMLENIRWIAVDHLRKTTPELRWSRWLSTAGNFMAMRVDRAPFDDVRVRRAINLAVHQQEIVDLFFGGNAELFAYPQHPSFKGYFEPLEAMPPSVRELFEYRPEKARRLIAEAGHPDGFSFRTQVSTSDPMRMELAPLIASYLERVGVTMEIEVVEYAAHLSMMTTRTHGPGYVMGSGHVNPTTTLRKNFVTGQTWNPSMWSDPELDRRIVEMFRTRDEAERQRIVRRITREMLDQAPYLWLPVPYVYTAWWPWVKNYGGELRAGAVRPGPIYARLWIDRELKRQMGFGR